MNVVLAKMVKKMVGENDKLTKQSTVDLSRIPQCVPELAHSAHPASQPPRGSVQVGSPGHR